MALETRALDAGRRGPRLRALPVARRRPALAARRRSPGGPPPVGVRRLLRRPVRRRARTPVAVRARLAPPLPRRGAGGSLATVARGVAAASPGGCGTRARAIAV